MQSDGFPTLLFFPAGNKSFDPVSGCYKFDIVFSLWLLPIIAFKFGVYFCDMFLIIGVGQITVDTDRTVVAFYKFIKKHASIPFKLQKPASASKAESSDAKDGIESSTRDVKDEL